MKELKTIRDILQAILDGHEVERQLEPQNTWESFDSMCLYTQYLDDEEVLHNRYRIKPTKPSINWEHVHPDCKYLSRDKYGSVFLYNEEPYAQYDDWGISGGYRISASAFASLKPGTCDWKDSLVERPKCI